MLFEVEDGKITGGKFHPARNVAPYLAHKYAGLNSAEIGNYFGGIHPSSVSQAARRIGKEMASDKELTKIIQGFESISKV